MNTIVKSRNRVQIDERGRTMYFIDGKLTSKENYENIMGPIPKPPKEIVEKISPNCVICGAVGTRRKFVNLQTVKLCEDDYQNKTTGEIAATIKR